ncbi:MAG: sel1 repeat family protein, partial [Sulfurovum sp.]|nr:SEL1-like repeat protein [Sulfurovum sp.]NNJ45865.1 sel1 repeat family protein [Sulfurovum sp.]
EGVKKNYSKAKRYYSKACDLNDKSGCYMLGFLYQYGSGRLEQNYSNAKKYYRRACDLNVTKGCISYNELKEKGY